MKKIKSACKYYSRCWRLIYTLACENYHFDIKNVPDRMSLLIAGDLEAFDSGIFPRGGIFCKNIPFYQNDKIMNACPETLGQAYNRCCTEYLDQHKRDLFYKKPVRKYKSSFGTERNHIPSATRRAVFQKFSYCCAYCGISLHHYQNNEKVRLEIDHRVPLAMGGTDEYSNLILACKECNNKKGANIWDVGCKKYKKG